MATVPTPITYVANTILTAAEMNANVRDSVNFLIARPAVYLTNSTAQAIATATFTVLTFDTESLDSDNTHSTTTNTGRFTAVTAGWYWVVGNIEYALSSSGGRLLRIMKNGTTPVAGCNVPAASATFQCTLSVTGMVYLNVGDYVHLEAWQNSGGSLSTTGPSGANGGTNMSVIWVHT